MFVLPRKWLSTPGLSRINKNKLKLDQLFVRTGKRDISCGGERAIRRWDESGVAKQRTRYERGTAPGRRLYAITRVRVRVHCVLTRDTGSNRRHGVRMLLRPARTAGRHDKAGRNHVRREITGDDARVSNFYWHIFIPEFQRYIWSVYSFEKLVLSTKKATTNAIVFLCSLITIITTMYKSL